MECPQVGNMGYHCECFYDSASDTHECCYCGEVAVDALIEEEDEAIRVRPGNESD